MKSKKQKEREALCKACQRCCKELYIYTHPVMYGCSAQKVIDFYEARGFSVTRLEKDALILGLHYPCPHLTPQGCAIYEKRPQACREYSGIEDFGEECLWSTLERER